jgi:predicted transcriptional regulator with HTH domain
MVPAFHKFSNSVRRKFLFLSLTKFASQKFLDRIITAVETWLPHCFPQIKAQSKTSKRPISNVAKKIRSEPSAVKNMLTVFWHMEGVILVPFTPRN